MTLNTKRLKVPHVHITNTQDSQISIRFALWPAIFELEGILRQVHWMTPKWLETLKDHSNPIYMLQIKPSLKFRLVLLYDQPFSSYRPFQDKCNKWLQMTLNTKKPKVRHIDATTTPESKISIHFTVWPNVFELQATSRQMHRMTPNDLEH